MAEYIEREAAMRASRHAWGKEREPSKYIEISPDDDVTPVVHGRWIEHKKYIFGTMYDCSVCYNRILDNGHAWNYCPNCGARMDGDSDAKAD